jgi:hypothetical protein
MTVVEGPTHFIPRISTTRALEAAAITLAPIAAILAAKKLSLDRSVINAHPQITEQTKATQYLVESADLSCGDSGIIFTSEGVLEN